MTLLRSWGPSIAVSAESTTYSVKATEQDLNERTGATGNRISFDYGGFKLRPEYYNVVVEGSLKINWQIQTCSGGRVV
jgi:hypothetical protein